MVFSDQSLVSPLDSYILELCKGHPEQLFVVLLLFGSTTSFSNLFRFLGDAFLFKPHSHSDALKRRVVSVLAGQVSIILQCGNVLFEGRRSESQDQRFPPLCLHLLLAQCPPGPPHLTCLPLVGWKENDLADSVVLSLPPAPVRSTQLLSFLGAHVRGCACVGIRGCVHACVSVHVCVGARARACV